MPYFTGTRKVPSVAFDDALLRYFDLPPRNWHDQLNWLHEGFGSWSYVSVFSDVSPSTLYAWRRSSPPLWRQLQLDRAIRNWFVSENDILLTLQTVPLYFSGTLRWSRQTRAYDGDQLPSRFTLTESSDVARVWLNPDREMYVKLREIIDILYVDEHNGAGIVGKCEFKLGGNLL